MGHPNSRNRPSKQKQHLKIHDCVSQQTETQATKQTQWEHPIITIFGISEYEIKQMAKFRLNNILSQATVVPLVPCARHLPRIHQALEGKWIGEVSYPCLQVSRGGYDASLVFLYCLTSNSTKNK